MKKIIKYAVLAVAFPFMVVGAIVGFAWDAFCAGVDVGDSLLGRLVQWIDR